MALEAARYSGGISKACGHDLKKSSCPHDPSTTVECIVRLSNATDGTEAIRNTQYQ